MLKLYSVKTTVIYTSYVRGYVELWLTHNVIAFHIHSVPYSYDAVLAMCD